MTPSDDNTIARLPPLPLIAGVLGACVLSIVLVGLVGGSRGRDGLWRRAGRFPAHAPARRAIADGAGRAGGWRARLVGYRGRSRKQ